MISEKNIHVIGSIAKGNIGTVAAQKGLYNLFLANVNIDFSISTNNKILFQRYQSEVSDVQIYNSVGNVIRSLSKNKMHYFLTTFVNRLAFSFSSVLIHMGMGLPYWRKTINRIRKCDLLIGLSLEQFKGIPLATSANLTPRKILIHKLYWSIRITFCLWYLFIIKSAFKKKLVVGPASFGPFDGLPLVIQKLVSFTLNKFVDLIFVREPYSAKILDNLKIKNFVLTTDLALMVKPKQDNNQQNDNFIMTIGFAPAKFTDTLTAREYEKYVLAHVECISLLLQKYAVKVVFLPSSSDDVPVCKNIMTRLKASNNHQIKLIITDDVDEYESWIRRLDFLITTRMHPSIIAARNFVPFYSIVYDHKQLGIMKQLGLQNYYMHINEISIKPFSKIIDQMLQEKTNIVNILRSNLPGLQDRSRNGIIDALNSLIRN